LEKVKVAVIGPGNIGQDLIIKLNRSKYLDTACVVNITESPGLQMARGRGIDCSAEGVDYLVMRYSGDIKIAFDCSSAAAHLGNASKLKASGIFTVDLTPAAVGPYCIPAVNMDRSLLALENVNLVTCAGQVAVPVVAAVNEAVGVRYAEVVSAISSKSAGPGTRANIDEFTVTTRKALENIGGAERAKVIIILNPAEPPIFMRNTIYTQLRNPDFARAHDAVLHCVRKVQEYVPGYRLLLEPTILRDDIMTTMVEVAGNGDFLPPYSGNLDIINAAAVQIGEAKAKQILGVIE
jgi:acetaldehyde dehydrogenase